MQPFTFHANPLDRAADKREDPAFIATALADARTGLVVFCEGRCLISSDPPRVKYLSPEELDSLGAKPQPPVFLGLDQGRALFAVQIEARHAERLVDAQFADLWRTASQLPDDEGSILAFAKGMLEWHARNRYCGLSGEKNQVVRAGHQLLGGGEHTQFPRVDPAIIVLTHRDDQCLLGRQAQWPAMQYATIAGFVEPGESLEDAVRREVKEETNINVTEVTYLASQPWPFPTSLMVGFHAVAGDGPIRLNDKELADARWFSRSELAAGEIRLPPSMSIAFHLIECWFDRPGETPLRELRRTQDWG